MPTYLHNSGYQLHEYLLYPKYLSMKSGKLEGFFPTRSRFACKPRTLKARRQGRLIWYKSPRCLYSSGMSIRAVHPVVKLRPFGSQRTRRAQRSEECRSKIGPKQQENKEAVSQPVSVRSSCLVSVCFRVGDNSTTSLGYLGTGLRPPSVWPTLLCPRIALLYTHLHMLRRAVLLARRT